jgi:hypothetical protein
MYDETPVCKFGLRENEFLRHLGLFGITGTGKSNVVFKLIDELMKKGKKVFVFDWKRQYRDFLSIRPDADVLIFGVGNDKIPTFQFNPLIPPAGIPPLQYLEHVCQIVASSYYCGEGVISLLRRAITDLYKEFGVHDSTAKAYPTFKDVLIYINNIERKGRSKDWQESTVRSLEAICHGGIGEIVNVQSPTMQLSELLNQNVFLELGDLGQSQKSFIIQSLLTYLYYFAMNRGVREKLLNVIVVEEAHHILRDHSHTTVKEPISDIILKEIREFSTGIIIIDQNPSLISVPALANNYTTIGMYSKHGSDISALGKAMFLNDDQKECLGKLECGHGIVKLAGRVFMPFLVKFPLMKIKKGSISDDEIAKRMVLRGYSRYSTTSRSYSTDCDLFPGYSISDKIDNQIDLKNVEDLIRREFNLSPVDSSPKTHTQEKIDDKNAVLIDLFLKDIKAHPFDGIASRTKRLAISPRKCNDAVNSLVNLGMIRKAEIKEKSGHRVLLEIIDKKESIHFPEKDGGIEHRYWNFTIGEINKKNGYTIELEKHIEGDGFIDQVITRDNKTIAIEIETGKSHPIETIKRVLSLGLFDKVICVATNQEAYEKILKGINENGLSQNDKVLIKLASNYPA